MMLRGGVDRLRGEKGTTPQLTTGKITKPRSGKNEWRKIKLYFTQKSILTLNKFGYYTDQNLLSARLVPNG